jgi:rRNA maturation endonuclease Nob1
MSKDKIKDFQEFIKQDFDVVEDYKASKELTPKEALNTLTNRSYEYVHISYNDKKAVKVREILLDDCSNKHTIVDKALTRLDDLEKKNTPMKPYWEHDYICTNCSNEFVEKTDKHCSNCGQKLDWGGDNKPLQNESGE